MLSSGRHLSAAVLAAGLVAIAMVGESLADRYQINTSRRKSSQRSSTQAMNRTVQFRTAELADDDGHFAFASDSQDEAPQPEAEELQEYQPLEGGDPWEGSCDESCYPPFWAHRNSVFVDALYLRPTNADLIYTIEMTGPDPINDSPTGPVGRVGTDFEPGVRGGFNFALSDCSSLFMSYTWFESEKESSIDAQAGNVLQFQVSHPSVANAGATSIQSFARQEIDFQLADIAYRHVFYGSECSALNYSVGMRYANLEQQMLAQQIIGVSTGLTTVTTDITFDGVGIGFGLDGERRSACSGLLIYGKAGAAFMAGEFKAAFRQTNQLGGAAVIGNDLIDYRLVSMLDAEIGAGWQNACGNLRATVGFQVAGWLNTLTTNEYVRGYKSNQFDDLGETLVFNGLTSRLEWRY